MGDNEPTNGEVVTPAASSAEELAAKAAAEAAAESPEEKHKKEHLANLDKAIVEASETLRVTREATQKEKAGKGAKEGEEEIPTIDLDDPGAKAWKREIDNTVGPVAAELEKEKAEVRTFALRKFLADKPALSANKEKLAEVMKTYEQIHTATERTQEGVLLDLARAYAAVFHDDLLAAAQRGETASAHIAHAAFDVAVDRGTTTYQNKKTTPKKVLSSEERTVLAKWGYSEEDYQKDHEQFGSRE